MKVILRNNKLNYRAYYTWVQKNFPAYMDAWLIDVNNVNNKYIFKESVPRNDEEYELIGTAPHGNPYYDYAETLALIQDKSGSVYIVDEKALEYVTGEKVNDNRNDAVLSDSELSELGQRLKKVVDDVKEQKIVEENVKKLRQLTGQGVMDCKNALLFHDNDFEKALAFLKSDDYIHSIYRIR